MKITVTIEGGTSLASLTTEWLPWSVDDAESEMRAHLGVLATRAVASFIAPLDPVEYLRESDSGEQR